MSSNHKVREGVDRLAAQVTAGRYGLAKPWGGADVVISATPPNPKGGDFYPNKRHVVTKYAKELSWLFESLRNVFGKALDAQNKYDFYARLADAADRYLSSGTRSTQSAKGLLESVAAEAWLMADEIK